MSVAFDTTPGAAIGGWVPYGENRGIVEIVFDFKKGVFVIWVALFC